MEGVESTRGKTPLMNKKKKRRDLACRQEPGGNYMGKTETLDNQDGTMYNNAEGSHNIPNLHET